MTTEQALYELKRKLPAKVFGTELYCQAYDMAIEALNKQIPQRCEEVYADSGNPEREFRYYCCPRCTEEIDGDWDYCPSCGQRLE